MTSFASRADLINTLATSSSIPFFTAPSVFGVSAWRGGFAVDGGVVNNVPIFQDNVRSQLIINLGFLDYPHLYTFSPLGESREVYEINTMKKPSLKSES